MLAKFRAFVENGSRRRFSSGVNIRGLFILSGHLMKDFHFSQLCGFPTISCTHDSKNYTEVTSVGLLAAKFNLMTQ